MSYQSLKRIFDIFVAITIAPIILITVLLLGILIKLTSKGPIIHWSKRIGKNNKVFLMPKLRTMHLKTPQVATHLLSSDSYITPLGKVLRKLSLDELPQLLSILKGDMSFVGPRPALFNQSDLIKLRTEKDVHLITPGITGWAQINGRDELSIPEKVNLDSYYLKKMSIPFDTYIIFSTLYKVIKSESVSH